MTRRSILVLCALSLGITGVMISLVFVALDKSQETEQQVPVADSAVEQKVEIAQEVTVVIPDTPSAPETEELIQPIMIQPTLPTEQSLSPPVETSFSPFSRLIVLDVPFTAQAPFGDWSDPVYQYGCEEASIVMAMRWVNGKTLTPTQARDEIIALTTFEKERYGFSHDTSAQDTARVMRDYYGTGEIAVEEDISVDDIISEIQKGNIVIVPVHGQKLQNPFYTPPGPVEHMMVVRGYDPVTREIITNDPGTRRGESFRYARDVFEDALRDYPTGFKEPISAIKKLMIIVYAP